MSVMDGTEQLARVVLSAANRTQAKGSTARLVVPRAPEVAQDLGMDLTDAQFLSVEEYLLEHGYVAPVDMGLAWGSYTITPAGLRWLETSLPETLPTDRMQELADRPGEEDAFESALRAELEEERHRMEVFWWELERLRLSELEPEGAEPRPGTGELPHKLRWRTVTERPWWRFWG